MGIFRVNKSKDYTTMSNYHLKDKRLSLKAKGLLSVMLSLPDDWNYSIDGLTAISKESEDTIKSTLKELKEYRYLLVSKKMPNETSSGRFEYIYDIYETPKQEGEKQGLELQAVEKQAVENTPLNKILNNKILNNKILNNNKNIKKKKYGEFKRVLLSDEEYERLVKDYGEDFINNQINLLDEYVESNNNKNKYTNFNLVLRKSIRENWFKNKIEKDIPKWMKEEPKIEEEKNEEFRKLVEEIEGTRNNSS